MSKKAITAIIGNTLFIDPSDKDKVNVEELRPKIEAKIKEKLHVSYMPISAWMTNDAAKAIMDTAIKSINKK